MIGHDLDPHSDHSPYAHCRSISDIERVLNGLGSKRAPLSWAEGVRAISHPGAALLQSHPRLLDLAVHLNRGADADLLEVVARVAAAASQD